ncbi:hypothetical protein U8335_04350 [Roseiconus lacunae]|uniref:hypothetical protein n=1 Tax=Roseiconus lacunae TaxID=2605694 RepID=UPI003088D83F|nr:hypothetical protein U8335_04350 [Stieleria sp. HD01]
MRQDSKSLKAWAGSIDQFDDGLQVALAFEALPQQATLRQAGWESLREWVEASERDCIEGKRPHPKGFRHEMPQDPKPSDSEYGGLCSEWATNRRQLSTVWKSRSEWLAATAIDRGIDLESSPDYLAFRIESLSSQLKNPGDHGDAPHSGNAQKIKDVEAEIKRLKKRLETLKRNAANDPPRKTIGG